MYNLNYNLDGEISSMITVLDGVKLSGPVYCSAHNDRQSGLKFSFHSQNSSSPEHHECIVCEI